MGVHKPSNEVKSKWAQLNEFRFSDGFANPDLPNYVKRGLSEQEGKVHYSTPQPISVSRILEFQVAEIVMVTFAVVIGNSKGA
jgi:hypothetical protein